MTINNVLLRRVEVTSEVTSIVFDNLPTTGYRDFYVVISARGNTAAVTANYFANFNDDSVGHSDLYLYGNGNGTNGSGVVLVNNNRLFIGDGNCNSATSNVFSNSSFYVSNYRSTGLKTISITSNSEQNSAIAFTELVAGQYNGAAISKMTLTIGNGTIPFMRYSTVSVYGVVTLGTTPTLAPYASGGDNITTDGSFWYHSFLSSGLFIPQRNLTCNYLVVGGGGGGGGDVGGGGGAGGLRSTVTATGGGGSLESPISVTAQNYVVTVGAGGAGGTQAVGNQGSNSSFSTITSLGGGFGGRASNAGSTGGSGGGGSGRGNVTGFVGAAGSGTTNQGRAGGTGAGDSSVNGQSGGGGGGASTAGTNGSVGNGGNGGAGVAVSITGSSVTYAGGGAGPVYTPGNNGSAGAGGGGAVGGSGTPNTGGGGGGAIGGSTTGGAGGSGIVIIRYPVL